jgi:arsenate reductase (thioredoxin)
MKKVLVLCTGNSCRSQIAEGYLRHFGAGELEVYSAGVETHGVNPLAIETMKEDGIDISGQTSNNVEEYRNIDFDFVVTVCDHARERCPFFPTNATKIHHNFADPAKATGSPEQVMSRFREVRTLIRDFAEKLVNQQIIKKN